ncbi:MAG TPA: DUF6456 domain-containing protein [Bauldia sp.]|nr:DUF6456 domain-containing protein [Bauldia sp.]
MRLLRRLASPTSADPDADEAAVHRLVRRGLAAWEGGRLTPTALGIAALRRHLAGVDGFAAQHQSRAHAAISDDKLGHIAVVVNDDESPLARLRRTKGRDGRPLLGDAEFAAGERLRSDFTRAHLMPRVTANWSASVAARRRDGGSGGMAELTDAVVAARQRVDRALAAVGPEFAGLLLDFCCFLKGIEDIERERSWPARSAKLVLRLALASLARHYGLGEMAQGAPSGGRTVHWGADDYRPEIKPE